MDYVVGVNWSFKATVSGGLIWHFHVFDSTLKKYVYRRLKGLVGVGACAVVFSEKLEQRGCWMINIFRGACDVNGPTDEFYWFRLDNASKFIKRWVIVRGRIS